MLADNRLVFGDFPPGDFGGSSNIDGANDVGMLEMTTFATQKYASLKTIAFVKMPALWAPPACVAGIDYYHWHTGQFRLVFNKSTQFCE
jgi:hypothetical protein